MSLRWSICSSPGTRVDIFCTLFSFCGKCVNAVAPTHYRFFIHTAQRVVQNCPRSCEKSLMHGLGTNDRRSRYIRAFLEIVNNDAQHFREDDRRIFQRAKVINMYNKEEWNNFLGSTLSVRFVAVARTILQ